MVQDNYGKSYYYRGNVKNNNVYFAGYFWQIIRINGDNSIRLLYNGNVKNTLIGCSRFNNNYNHPIYVGYMYGNINSTTYDELILGGMSAGNTNSYSWVNNSLNYYSMTPVIYNWSVNSATVFGMKSTGELNVWRVSDNVGVRPVINLKADVEISGGIGTMNDPYVINKLVEELNNIR